MKDERVRCNANIISMVAGNAEHYDKSVPVHKHKPNTVSNKQTQTNSKQTNNTPNTNNKQTGKQTETNLVGSVLDRQLVVDVGKKRALGQVIVVVVWI